MRFIIILALLFHSMTWADSSFENHFHHTSQAMSALYMYELSNANPEYLATFKKHIYAANQTIKKTSNNTQSIFLNRWQELLPYWIFKKVRYTEDLYLDEVVRYEAREYLTDLFLHLQTIHTNDNSSQQKITDIKLYTAMLLARALDILSTHQGSAALSQHDKKINAKSLSKTVHANIKYLLSEPFSTSQHKNLRKVRDQFEFIDRNITGYDYKMPYFLLYKSVINMKKRLNSHPHILANR